MAARLQKLNDSLLDRPLKGVASMNKQSISYATNLFHPALPDDLLKFESVSYSNNIVALTLTLPEGLLKPYTEVLSSLTDFVRFLAYKSKLAKNISVANSPEEIKRRKGFKEAYIKEVCSIFDSLIKKGVPARKVISDTNNALKKQGHVWADYYLTEHTLRQEGKLKGFSQELKGGGRHGESKRKGI